MGVQRLMTYVNNVKRAVSSQVQLDVRQATPSLPNAIPPQNKSVDEKQESTQQDTPSPKSVVDKPVLVVDAWAFMFEVWLQNFGEAIRSLDYAAYKHAVQTILDAWLAAGASVIVVFDGPCLPSKIPTITSRRAEVAAGNQLFMTSSANSRMSASLQTKLGVIPTFVHSATVDLLMSMKNDGKMVDMVFAPTEADSLVAEIATEHERGYALSQDSDFFILCSRGKGCAGYVPINSLEYIVKPNLGGLESKVDASQAVEQDDDGFQQVTSKKKRAKDRALPLIPDSLSVSDVLVKSFPPIDEKIEGTLEAVRFQAYRSHDLAAHLQLPPTLLPLFAAIVGNDYTTSVQSQHLHKHIRSDQRISVVADLLRNEWVRLMNETRANANAPARRLQGRFAMSSLHDHDDGRSDVDSSATATPVGGARNLAASTIVQHDPVRSLVEAVVDKLLKQGEQAFGAMRHNVTTGEREAIVDSIIDSAATYSLLTHSDAPHLSSPSALFFGEAMALLGNRYKNQRIAHPQALQRYRDAYHAGHFRENLIDIMAQRIIFPRYQPEDVDSPSIHTTATRELRLWVYAVLFEVWGMSWARKEWLPASLHVPDEEEDEEDAVRGPGTHLFQPNRGYKEGELPDDLISVDTESSASTDGDDEALDDLPSRPASVTEVREEEKDAPGVREFVRTGTLYSEHLVQILPLIELLRDSAEGDVSGDGASDHVEDTAKHLPASMAELLGQHEASQPGVTDMLGHDRQTQAIKMSNSQSPESDPAPPPAVMLPLSVRLDLFLHAHGACTALIKALPVSHWLPAAVLRYLVLCESKRLGASRRKHNWSRNEVIVAARSMVLDLRGYKNKYGRSRDACKDEVDIIDDAFERHTGVTDVYPSTRAIHFSSHVQLMLDTSSMLAQALLLPGDVEVAAKEDEKTYDGWSKPYECFVGPIFHIGMARIHNEESAAAIDSTTYGDGNGNDDNGNGYGLPLIDDDGFSQKDGLRVRAFVHAVLEGLHDALGIDELQLRRERKAQKAAKRQAKQQQRHEQQQQQDGNKRQQQQQQRKQNQPQNAFAALLDHDSD